MAFPDDNRTTTEEAARAAWDTARRYLDSSASINQAYLAFWTPAVQYALDTALSLQIATVEASQFLLDAAVQANLFWFEQAREAVGWSRGSDAGPIAADLEMSRPPLPEVQG